MKIIRTLFRGRHTTKDGLNYLVKFVSYISLARICTLSIEFGDSIF